MDNPPTPLIITQPDNGGDYTLNRPMTRSEAMNLLHCCQNGEASCLYTLKVFEANEALCQEYANAALTLIRDGDKMDYTAWARSVARAGLEKAEWLKEYFVDKRDESK
jgi:hypothetical protein